MMNQTGCASPSPVPCAPSAQDPQHNAQILLTMKDSDGQPCPFEPRVILQNVLARFHQHGLFPVIAPEIEF
jgi:gamma-glutamylputrescine synthase